MERINDEQDRTEDPEGVRAVTRNLPAPENSGPFTEEGKADPPQLIKHGLTIDGFYARRRAATSMKCVAYGIAMRAARSGRNSYGILAPGGNSLLRHQAWIFARASVMRPGLICGP